MRTEDRDYREVLDPHRRRKVLLYRAALACAVMLLLVAGLSLYDDGVPVEIPPPVGRIEVTPAPLEVVPVEDRPGESPAFPGDLHDEPAEEVEAVLDVEPEAPHGDAGSEQEALAIDEGATDPVVAPVVSEPRPVPPRGTPAPAPGRVPPVSRVADPAASAPVGPSGYLVRLGDHAQIDEAERLVAELLAAGHPARIQWRVSAGPYANRAAAIEALRRLDRDHRLRGFAVQLPDGRHVVQLGVFGEVTNADGLQRRVRSWGYPVLRDARIVVGPYAERSAADAAATEFRQSRGLQAVVVARDGR